MKNEKPWYKKWWVFLLGVVILAIIIAIPFVINWAYLKGTADGQPNTAFSASDIILFYGSVLTFVGTVSLGALALWQNKKANEISIRLLTLEEHRNKPILEIIPLTVDGENQPFVSKIEKDYDIKFFIHNSSPNAAFNIKTINMWISSVKLHDDKDTIESKREFELPEDKLDWGANYDFQGYLKAGDCREIQAGINFVEGSDIRALTDKYGGRYFFSVTFSFSDCYNKKYIETTTILISRITDFETGELKYERIFNNKIEIKEDK